MSLIYNYSAINLTCPSPDLILFEKKSELFGNLTEIILHLYCISYVVH